MPYPTLYLSHGGGGNEVDWTTQGVANRIIDNLIAGRMVQPMVIVMTDFNNLGSCNLFPPDEDASCYATDVSNYVIPYVNAHYNVSTDANDRAFAGLSLGGLAANYLLFNDTTLFGYFGSWSIANLGAPATTSSQWQNPALKTRLGIELGGGNFDELTIPGLDSYEATFTSFGIPFTDVRIDGGHEWYTWRQLLYDYATTMAFRHTTTSLQGGRTRGRARRDSVRRHDRAGSARRDRAVLRKRPEGRSSAACGARPCLPAAVRRRRFGDRHLQRRQLLQREHEPGGLGLVTTVNQSAGGAAARGHRRVSSARGRGEHDPTKVRAHAGYWYAWVVSPTRFYRSGRR